MIAASFLFAVMGTLVKLAAKRIPAAEIVTVRFFVSAVVMAPLMWRKRLPIFGHNRAWLFFRSSCGFCAGLLGFFVLAKLPLADATLLNYSSPIFVAPLSAIFFKERVSPTLAFCIAVAVVGCAFVLKPGFAVFNVAGLSGVGAAFMSALAYMGIKQLHKTESSLTVVFHFSVFSAFAGAILFGWSFVMPKTEELLALAAIGVLGVFAQVFLTAAYQHDDASRISPYSYAIVIFAAILGVLFFGEVPDALTFVGGILIVMAGIVMARSSHRRTVFDVFVGNVVRKTRPLKKGGRS